MEKQSKQQTESKQNGVTYFQIGPDEAKDIVSLGDLIMELALARTVVKSLETYVSAVEMNGGSLPSLDIVAPDEWAIAGMWSHLDHVSHLLKVGYHGY